MATYPNEVEEPAALASGTTEVAAPPIDQGSNLVLAPVVDAATGQYKDCKKRLTALAIPQATSDEVATTKRRKHQVESISFDGATPAWAQVMVQQMAEMVQQMGVLLQQTQGLLQGMWQQQEQSQRMENRERRTDMSPICKLIRLSEGTLPDDDMWFPTSLKELNEATETKVNPLLDFYGLSYGASITAKRTTLIIHLGIAA